MLCLTVVYLRDIANMTFSILNLNVNHLSICSSCWTTRMNDMRGPAIERDALGPTLAQNWAWLTSVSGWPSVKKEYPTPTLSWDFFFFFFWWMVLGSCSSETYTDVVLGFHVWVWMCELVKCALCQTPMEMMEWCILCSTDDPQHSSLFLGHTSYWKVLQDGALHKCFSS